MNAERGVVVTGAAGGIGLGVARRFAAADHPVAMLDADADLLERESTSIEGRVLAKAVDVTDRAAIEAAYAEIRETLGPILIVVANAGISHASDFLTMSTETWTRMIDVNLTGVFHTIQPALADMVAAKWGRVITISSNAAQIGSSDRSHYAAAKGGVIGLTKGLARELARHGVTVNTIPPSLVDTPLAQRGVASGEVPPLEMLSGMIPIARPGTPDDIAAACEFLASDGASYVTGQQINVNGGMYM